jgi:signal peptidase II
MQAARGTSIGDHQSGGPTSVSTTSRRRSLAVFVTVGTLAYLIDLLTKWLAVRELHPGEQVQVVGDFLTLYLVRNPGAAFSTGPEFTMVFSLIAFAATTVVVVLAFRLGSVFWAVGLGFLLGGVLGNLTDRIFRAPGFLEGHVVDFLRLPNWPVFNCADIFIDIAAGVIIVQAMRGVAISGARGGDGDE